MGIMDQANNFLNSDAGEQHSDAAIQQGKDALSNATGGKHDEHLGQAADFADGKIGNSVPEEGPGAEQGN